MLIVIPSYPTLASLTTHTARCKEKKARIVKKREKISQTHPMPYSPPARKNRKKSDYNPSSLKKNVQKKRKQVRRLVKTRHTNVECKHPHHRPLPPCARASMHVSKRIQKNKKNNSILYMLRILASEVNRSSSSRCKALLAARLGPQQPSATPRNQSQLKKKGKSNRH